MSSDLGSKSPVSYSEIGIGLLYRAMGWLFGCFRIRKERPVLRHQRNKQIETLTGTCKAARKVSTRRDKARQVLPDSSVFPQDYRSLQFEVGRLDDEAADLCKEENETRNLQEEVHHLRSCGIILQTPQELQRTISRTGGLRKPNSWIERYGVEEAARTTVPDDLRNEFQSSTEHFPVHLSREKHINNNSLQKGYNSEMPMATSDMQISEGTRWLEERTGGSNHSDTACRMQDEFSVSANDSSDKDESSTLAVVRHDMEVVKMPSGKSARSKRSNNAESEDYLSIGTVFPASLLSTGGKENLVVHDSVGDLFICEEGHAAFGGSYRTRNSVFAPVENLPEKKTTIRPEECSKGSDVPKAQGTPCDIKDESKNQMGSAASSTKERLLHYIEDVEEHSTPVSSESKSQTFSLDERPILGLIAADPNSVKSYKSWDGKGIPNSTTKYKEDQKVNWQTTPFETRLERALANLIEPSPRLSRA